MAQRTGTLASCLAHAVDEVYDFDLVPIISITYLVLSLVKERSGFL